MDTDRMKSDGHRWRVIVGWSAFAVIAALLLVSEHRLHVLGALPFLLLLACPLMHIFMHGGHGGHGGHARTRDDADAPAERPGADRI